MSVAVRRSKSATPAGKMHGRECLAGPSPEIRRLVWVYPRALVTIGMRTTDALTAPLRRACARVRMRQPKADRQL